jgi:hypothetical protein
MAGDILYVLEANPRASRTVPFTSKATAVPLAKAAARISLGATIAELRACLDAIDAAVGELQNSLVCTLAGEPIPLDPRLLMVGQKRVEGFSGGRPIHYYDLGPVAIAPGNDVVTLYAPTNGVAGQHNVTADTLARGQTRYPPLWRIVQVTWKPGAARRLLRSFADIRRAQAAGTVTLRRTALVVNCPIVP